MNHLSSLIEFPESGFIEEQMSYEIIGSSEQTDRLTAEQAVVHEVVMGLRAEQNLLGHPAQWTDEQRTTLHKAIRANIRWQNATRNLIRLLLPELHGQVDVLDKLYAPHWIDSRLRVIEAQIDSSGLHSQWSLGHAYISQVSESMNLPSEDILTSTSIIGAIKSSEGAWPIGLRGGSRYADVWHFAPAGFIDLLPRGQDFGTRHPIFANWFSELKDELGLGEKQTAQMKCIGLVTTNVFENGGNTNFILTGNSELTSNEISGLHSSSAAYDRHEHQRLEHLASEDLIEWVGKTSLYEPKFVDPQNPAQTTEANMNTVMPQASLGLLLIAQQIGLSRGEIDECLSCLQEQQKINWRNAKTNEKIDFRNWKNW